MIFDNGVKANQQGKDSLFNKRYQENWTSLSIRMKLDPSVTLCNSKLIKDLNPRSKIQDQHLINSRRKHRAKTSQHGIQQWSLSYNTKGTENKRKINKQGYRVKTFRTAEKKKKGATWNGRQYDSICKAHIKQLIAKIQKPNEKSD